MRGFHKLTVSDIYKTTSDCAVLTFEVPDDLKETFQYQQGQYLTLYAEINGEDVRRSYSLCSSPLDNEWKVAVKKIDGGRFSTFANDVLKPGDELQVMPPNGQFFTKVNKNQAKHYVLFAAGSGITPMLSIMKTHLAAEPESTFTLFYLNKNVKSIIFKEEIEGLKNQYFGRVRIFHLLTREARNAELFNGRFTKEKIETFCKMITPVAQIDEAFICGPEEMIFLIKDTLAEAGLDIKKIHFELFSSPDQKKNGKAKKVIIDRSDFTKVTIIDGGKDFHFEIGKDDPDNILDAALAKSADLPFACKGGVCCTCKAKLIEGTVKMKVNYALEEDDVKKGYILTCQAVPTSAKVVVDFDS